MEKFWQKIKDCVLPHDGNNHEPHFLRHRFVTFILFVVMVTELVFLIQVMFVFNRTNFLASVLPGVLTTLTNEARAQNGAPALKENALLVSAAQMKANDMASRGYFAHVSPDGKNPWYWLAQSGYKFKYAGENLAVNFFESENVARAWMNSPTHRANIVKKEYEEVGIALAHGVYQGYNTVFVVQFFGTPIASSEVPISIATTKSTTTQSATTQKTTTPTIKPNTEKNNIEKTIETDIPTPKTVTSTSPINTPIAQNTVLGEEIAIGDTEASRLEKVVTSPLSSISYFYLVLGGFMLSLLLVFYIRSEIMHPHVVIKTLCLVSIIIILGIFNLNQFGYKTEVPEGEQSYIAL